MSTIDEPARIETPAIIRFVQTWRRAVEQDLPADPCPRPTTPGGPDHVVAPIAVPRHPDRDEARALAAAADQAVTAYPGPVGELVRREIRAHLDFGHRFGNDAALVARLVRDVLGTEPADRGSVPGPV
ncbi:MAG: hypothetical protein L0I76_20995 [Pseudonocardia sp.]|nr:hypothetical protein [Pseudonocardia sp.]